MFVDSHCHIYKEYYADIDQIMEKIFNGGISKIINNGCDYESCLEVLELSKSYENVYCALGLHPENDMSDILKVIDLIKNNKNNKKMVAIGEIGLDYHYEKDSKDKQIDIFRRQLDLAQELDLPVIIHSRDATGDMLKILKDYKLRGVIHCFNGSIEVAKEYIKMGFKLGINGVITFKNCKLIDVIKSIGVNNIVFETDSPYLSPVPYRGTKNDSTNIKYIAEFISSNLSISVDELSNITNKNVSDIFDI